MVFRLLLQTAACVLIGIGILWACRWVQQRDRVAGAVVQAGVLFRLLAGLALFWISYLDLPLLRGLHSADGFWEPDARSYFWAATVAIDGGLGTVGDWSASPSYVKALAIWMHIVGVSPASGLYLNLVSYVCSAVLITMAFGRHADAVARRARLLALAALTFSPGLILSASEPLKDQFFSLCLVTMSVAASIWLIPIARGTFRGYHARIAIGFLAMCATVYVVAGIRPYVSFFCVAGVAAVFAAYAWRQPPRRLVRYAGAALLAIGLLWSSFAQGAGAYYPYYESKVLGIVGIAPRSEAPANALESARAGFVRSGGGTSLVRRPPRVHDGNWLATQIERARAVTFGLAASTIPISLLEALSIVEVSGGHGLLFVVDVDTLFVDASCLAVILFLFRERRRLRSAAPYVLYAATAAGVMALLMAYVVTNLGTLFRLRLIPATIVWLLPLAFAVRQPATIEVEEGAGEMKQTDRAPVRELQASS